MTHKKIKPQDNAANMQNVNKGVQGQNQQAAQNQGNIGKQKNPKNRQGK